MLRQRASRTLARLLPSLSEGLWPSQAAPAATQAALAAAAQQQQFSQLWQQLGGPWASAGQRHGFAAAAAAVAAAEPAAAAAAEPALPDIYVRLGQPIAEQYRVQPKRVFAVVEVGGTQYKVTPNDTIVVEKLAGVDVNDRLQLQRVLLLGSAAETIIGRPYVPEAAVTAAVEEQFLDGKVLIFHKRRRKNSRRLRGHRQPLTTLRILDVHGIEEAAAAAAVGAP
ncbi:hypothetical protein ABPG75_000974 [Micractinium tetrahymenae]